MNGVVVDRGFSLAWLLVLTALVVVAGLKVRRGSQPDSLVRALRIVRWFTLACMVAGIVLALAFSKDTRMIGIELTVTSGLARIIVIETINIVRTLSKT